MSKLIKPILCMLFVMALGYKSFGQQQIPPPPVPQGVPVYRRIGPYNQRGLYSRGIPVYPRFPANRQNPGMRVERVKEAYIGQQMRLTPAESSAFWPLYRQYVQDQTAVRILKRQNNSRSAPGGREQIERDQEYDQQLVDIRKHYTDAFLQILPPQKISILFKSERQFNDEVLNILKEQAVPQRR